MKEKVGNEKRSGKLCRLWFSCLALAITVLLAVQLAPRAQAASWMDPYLDKVVAWDVMRGDIAGNLNPNNQITRAEFVSMVNRAYGYTQKGPTPFKDVRSNDWFYEDIGIAYNAGYFAGTGKSSASPYGLLTREQAAVLIGRNMMLEEGSGESLGFKDSREFSEWSRHMIEAVLEEEVINGYSDGTFKPKKNVTRGEVAVMLVRAIGTPIQKSGVQSLGGVYGNVTIATSGVTLKDTTVIGDLYISGGVDLGNVVLENVTVHGKIVVGGSGESEKGEHSVILRNVRADELLMDSMANQFVTLKSEGLTEIPLTHVKTGAYLEDRTEKGLGLQTIELDGEPNTAFTLSGNIKTVLDKTPGSKLTLAQGIAASINIDETAKDTQLQINNKAHADEVNIDAATKITGTGAIGHLTVNAPGASAEMLPDKITIRPGLEADIRGETMDSVAAIESSEDPRLLSGYPDAENVAPTSAEIVFKTNKKGTVYWAITSVADGTVEEEELIHPPKYSGKILKSGSMEAKSSNTEYRAKLSGLKKAGSYYVSAILVDNRNMRSPVKITAFTTADDTVPAFTAGYPYALIADGKNHEQILQAMVMANKNCRMYYALLPKGSAAPTGDDFKANAVSGNLGYGNIMLQKNTPFLIDKVNAGHLDEVTEYDLYLWLTDADGAKSSAVKKLTVKTLDRTPPKITSLTVTDVKPTSITLNFTMNEPGTFYWAVVKNGAEFYTKGVTKGTKEAMIQIESGINALKNGNSKANKAQSPVKFTISGLEAQTAYDVHYMAKDTAGNYCIYTETIDLPFKVHTLDNQPPTVLQEFSHDGTEGDVLTPYPDSSIRLVFSEDIQGMLDRDKDGAPDYINFLKLYQDAHDSNVPEVTVDDMAEILSEYIKLYEKDVIDPVPVRSKKNPDGPWVIDYRNVKIEMDPSGSGNLIMTFPYNDEDPEKSKSALNLAGGVTYYFTLEGIADTSDSANRMVGIRGVTTLKPFTTISAQIVMAESFATTDQDYDMMFSAKPISHTAMGPNVLWDLMLWSDSTVEFEVYESKDDGEHWTKLEGQEGNKNKKVSITTPNNEILGVSIGAQLRDGKFQTLNELEDRIYGIKFLSINGDSKRDNWNQPVTMQITAVSGNKGALTEAGRLLQNSGLYDTVVGTNKNLSDITTPLPFTLTHTFMDNTPPKFAGNTPMFETGDSSVKISVMLDRIHSYYYYVIAPVGVVNTVMDDGTTITGGVGGNWENLIPANGTEALAKNNLVKEPNSIFVMRYTGTVSGSIKSGQGMYNGSMEPFEVKGLTANTDYIAYFVLSGEGQHSYSKQVQCFRFSTGDVDTPIITLQNNSPQVSVQTDTDAELDWILISSNMANAQPILNSKFYQYIGPNQFDEKSATQSSKQQEFTKHYQTYFAGDGFKDPNEVRVIDALAANIGANNTRSVFDIYAGANIYDQVLHVIRESTGTAYLTDQNSMSCKKNTSPPDLVTPKNMSSVTQYYFIAAARNTMGTRFGFKAVGDIHLVDATPPDVNSCFTQITRAKQKMGKVGPGNQEVPVGDTLGRPGQFYYDGEVTISFSKTPYRVYYEDGKYKTEELQDGNIKDTLSASCKITDATIKGQTVKIVFEDATYNTFIQLFADGWIGDVYGNAQNGALALTFDAPFVNTLPKEERVPPEFKYEWKRTQL